MFCIATGQAWNDFLEAAILQKMERDDAGTLRALRASLDAR
jgi:hypothetical protein